MSVSSLSAQNINQQSQPVKENNRPSKQMSNCDIAIVALAVLLIVSFAVVGVTLTTLGAITANPLMLELGITLIAAAVLGIFKIAFIACLSCAPE